MNTCSRISKTMTGNSKNSKSVAISVAAAATKTTKNETGSNSSRSNSNSSDCQPRFFFWRPRFFLDANEGQTAFFFCSTAFFFPRDREFFLRGREFLKMSVLANRVFFWRTAKFIRRPRIFLAVRWAGDVVQHVHASAGGPHR